jgi:hypothetical protein
LFDERRELARLVEADEYYLANVRYLHSHSLMWLRLSFTNLHQTLNVVQHGRITGDGEQRLGTFQRQWPEACTCTNVARYFDRPGLLFTAASTQYRTHVSTLRPLDTTAKWAK